MLDQKTIGWTPGPLSGAFSFFRITISGDPDMAPGFSISGDPDMAPALPHRTDTQRGDSR